MVSESGSARVVNEKVNPLSEVAIKVWHFVDTFDREGQRLSAPKCLLNVAVEEGVRRQR